MPINQIRILHPSAKEWMKRGFRDFFSIYVGMGACTLYTALFMWDYREGMQITRYKSSYTVYRNTDEELKMYPKSYITDNQLLSSDHPTKLEDCDDLPKGKPVITNRTFRQFSFMVK